jgi:NO-binding membrane sensor protein with MHYT domain
MDDELASATPPGEPSALLVLLALLVAALALKVVLTSAREGERARGLWPTTLALWPGVLAWGLGLWAAGLLALVGLEPVNDLRFSPLEAASLFLLALLSGVPPLWLLARRHTDPRSTRRLAGAALLMAVPAMALPLGWLQAARLEPGPLWLPLWPLMGVVVSALGLGAALALAYSALGEGHPARRLWRTAAAVLGGALLVLGQVLVHEGALVSEEAFSRASATLSVALMSGLGAITPMLLVALMVLQRLRRYVSEDERQRGQPDRRRRPRTHDAGARRRPQASGLHASSEQPDTTQGPDSVGAGTPSTHGQRRSRHRRHKVL